MAIIAQTIQNIPAEYTGQSEFPRPTNFDTPHIINPNIINVDINNHFFGICDNGITISIIMDTIPEKTLVLNMLQVYIQYLDAHEQTNFLHDVLTTSGKNDNTVNNWK